MLRKNGITIDGSVCTIGKHNVKHPKEIVDFFRKNHIGFKPRPVNILGRELENNMAPENGDWYKCFVEMYHRSKKTGTVNFSIHIFEENAYTPIRDYICLRYPCGAAREIISVNPNGDVFPCDGFKGVQEFKMGNILEKLTENNLIAAEQILRSTISAENINMLSIISLPRFNKPCYHKLLS